MNEVLGGACGVTDSCLDSSCTDSGGCMIGTATLGIADIMTCALTAAFLMIITGCLQMRDAYRALQGDVLLLIAGTIALGTAMQKTGASQLYAESFLSLFSGFSQALSWAAAWVQTG